MMKQFIIIIPILLLTLSTFAQKKNNGIEYKYNLEPIYTTTELVWYGNDLSRSHMLDFKQFEEGGKIKKVHFPGILAELEYRYNQEFMLRSTKKEKVIFDMVSIQDLYKTNLDASSFIVSRSTEMTIEDIKDIVKLYNLPQKKGVGVVNIVEMFHKPEVVVTGYVTFFDIATREVYYSTKMKGVAGGGGGFNLYWSNGIKRIMQYFFVNGYYSKAMKQFKNQSSTN